MRIYLILTSLLVISCATAATWKPLDVSFKDQPWRICTNDLDGEEFHLKGLCYWQKQIKSRRLRTPLVRRVHKFCSFEDKVCLLKFPLAGKKVK